MVPTKTNHADSDWLRPLRAPDVTARQTSGHVRACVAALSAQCCIEVSKPLERTVRHLQGPVINLGASGLNRLVPDVL